MKSSLLILDLKDGRLQDSGKQEEGKTFHKFFFLLGYVEERLWWPIQSPNIGRKKKANS